MHNATMATIVGESSVAVTKKAEQSEHNSTKNQNPTYQD
jgi:hypothetical protein